MIHDFFSNDYHNHKKMHRKMILSKDKNDLIIEDLFIIKKAISAKHIIPILNIEDFL